MRRRLFHLIKKEFLQLRRDRSLLPMVLIMPIMQLAIFGYAVRTDVKDIKLAVFDQDVSAYSRRLTEKFTNSGYFIVTDRVANEKGMTRSLDSGRASVALRLPRGLGGSVESRRPKPLQIITDGSNSNMAGVAIGYANMIAGRESLRLIEPGLRRLAPGGIPEVESRVRLWYNPNALSVNYMVPGLIAMLLMIGITAMTSQAIVRERERGTLEQLMVTPVSRTELILGKLIPYSAIGLTQATLIMVAARLWFRVPFNGSLALFYASAVVFLFAAMGQGLLVSAISKTRQQAMMTTMMLTMPAMLLSGFAFPLENMPSIIQMVSYLVPMRYFLVVVRGIFLKGVGLEVLWPQLALLVIYGTAIFTISVIRFNKKLE